MLLPDFCEAEMYEMTKSKYMQRKEEKEKRKRIRKSWTDTGIKSQTKNREPAAAQQTDYLFCFKGTHNEDYDSPQLNRFGKYPTRNHEKFNIKLTI